MGLKKRTAAAITSVVGGVTQHPNERTIST